MSLYATPRHCCGHWPDTKHAEAALCQARNPDRTPPPRGAQETVLDDHKPRHSSRLPAQRWRRHVERARRRQRGRVGQAHRGRRRSRAREPATRPFLLAGD